MEHALLSARLGLLLVMSVGLCYLPQLQTVVNELYQFLLDQTWYHSAYFETVWVTFCYAVMVCIPCWIGYVPFMDNYKMDKGMHWQDAGVGGVMLEVVWYTAPLLFLDAVIPKKYDNVSSLEFQRHGRTSWIQVTRAMPEDAPPVLTICFHIVGALVIFDVLFYVVHRTLHENPWLYHHIHRVHHNHHTVHTRVTNQLHFIERSLLLLCANIGLRVMHAHPFTRTIFVMVFVMWLIDNHTGYHLPITIGELVPFGLVAGPSVHFMHHQHGSKNYQPFFTYLDKLASRTRYTSK